MDTLDKRFLQSFCCSIAIPDYFKDCEILEVQDHPELGLGFVTIQPEQRILDTYIPEDFQGNPQGFVAPMTFGGGLWQVEIRSTRNLQDWVGKTIREMQKSKRR